MVRVSGDRSDTIVSQAHPLFVNTTGRDDDMVPTVDIPPPLYFTEDPHFGVITIVGVTAPGSVGSVPILYDQTVVQLSDTFTWASGTTTPPSPLSVTT